MDNLLKKEYFHVGTDHIYKELWWNIQMDQRNQLSKPYGGLWASKLQTEYNRLCDWVDYLEESNHIELERISYKKSCLIKFKENIQFLQIDNKNDFNNLKDSGFVKDISKNPINFFNKQSTTEILDYEKISDYFDLLYIEYGIHPSFKKFCINTMLALNPDAIEYYKPVVVDYSKQQIKKIEEKKYVTDLSDEFYSLYNYVEHNYKDVNFDGDYQKYIKNLYNYKNELIKVLKKDIAKSTNFQNKILDDTIVAILENLYRESYRKKQKMLKIN